MIRTLGYKNIQLLILNGDPYDNTDPVHLNAIIDSENFKFIQNYLKTLLIDGIFGYNEANPFTKTHFSPPIATIPLNLEIIQAKRKKFLLK
jgi:hypothetical protein